MSLIIKNQIIGYLLALFMVLALLNSAYYFFVIVQLSIGGWLGFNACSLSMIVYLVCFTGFQMTRKFFFLAIALVPLYYYGTMGLFIIPWDAANMFSQITHIIITLNVIWVLWIFLKESQFESLGKGLLIGVLVFVPVFAVIQNYSQLHAAEIIQMLQKIQ